MTIDTKRALFRWQWLLLLGLAGVIIFVPLPARSTAPVERTFRLQARQFEYTPALLQVNPGDRVTIELQAMDVVHGLSIDGYDQVISADPGQVARLSFIAGKQGSYRFRCSVTCGNLHPFMIGKLQVGQNSLFIRAALLALLLMFATGIAKWK